ncbi:MAG: ferrous iron transport protein B [Bacteroidota bacterium]
MDLKIALVGNPNSGKTSLFNILTGLQQKVGNFPGVTVDKKVGKVRLEDSSSFQLIDFPGTYSFYPTSSDERLVVQTFINPEDTNYPDAFLYVADATKLEKHLLLLHQIKDIGRPVVLALNMVDLVEQSGMSIDTEKLSKKLGMPVVGVSGRTRDGVNDLKEKLKEIAQEEPSAKQDQASYQFSKQEVQLSDEIKSIAPKLNAYQRLVLAHHHDWLPYLSNEDKRALQKITQDHQFEPLKLQVRETMQRYDQFTPVVKSVVKEENRDSNAWSERLDAILTHRIAGPFIFVLLMLLVFQAIFAWAGVPQDLIEGGFGWLTETLNENLPAGWLTSLLTDGLIAGLGGILVFIPQIAILFFLIAILEEVGYMARAAFMFDRFMQFFGLNGRSIVALISGGACAIPAVMSTRTISNWKERLITILVTPFISCSARIPVYAALIAFAVPATTYFGGLIGLRGLAFMFLYLLGIAAALLAALVFKLILKTNETSYLMLELPEYRPPMMRNVLLTVWEKVKTFTIEAGKIILIISLILWVMSNYGPKQQMEAARSSAITQAAELQLDATATDDLIAASLMEASYAGQLGKFIEPAIKPLGFDWKIGIALISSFAAREVFVGTMAIIYSVGSSEDTFTIQEKMAQEVRPGTNEKVYTPATSWSLLLFYVFAMQCMSTLAVVKRETKSWKWPIIQFVFMTALAYLSSFAVYQLLS